MWRKGKGHSEAFLLGIGKERLLYFIFINEHSTAKCPLALQKQGHSEKPETLL